jgi:hypothetical protein
MHYPSTVPLMCKNPEKKRIRNSDFFLVIKEIETPKLFNSIKEAAIYLEVEPYIIYNVLSRGELNEWCELPIIKNNDLRLFSVMKVEKKDIVNKLYLKLAKE